MNTYDIDAKFEMVHWFYESDDKFYIEDENEYSYLVIGWVLV